MPIIRDGMRYPSIDNLIEKTNSKYLLVVGAAKRARDIEKEGKTLIETPYNKKAIGIALEEIAEDKITIYDVEQTPDETQLINEQAEQTL